jgi:hypothetical protein
MYLRGIETLWLRKVNSTMGGGGCLSETKTMARRFVGYYPGIMTLVLTPFDFKRMGGQEHGGHS